MSFYPLLYFGVELELNVAYIYPNEVIEDITELKPSSFRPTESMIDQASAYLFRNKISYAKLFNEKNFSDEILRIEVMKRTIYQSIRDDLRAAGLPINQTPAQVSPVLVDVSKWDIEGDTSISPPNNKYHWLGVELKSPAYDFTPENLAAVQKVCKILTTKYLTNTNESTGLHVHVSFGTDIRWRLRSVKQAMMFFWAFHHQFDTLHPANRQGDSQYTQSMRGYSSMSANHLTQTGHRITAYEGCKLLEKHEDMEALVRAVCEEGTVPNRYMAYNVKPIFNLLRPDLSSETPKTTIEFRQHEGTLDGERVTQWVKLLCGVIRWIEIVEPSSLMNLMRLTKHETWSKTGDKAQDDLNESKFGPVLAEGPFMITDLLEHMSLQESADFYRRRLYEVSGGVSEDQEFVQV